MSLRVRLARFHASFRFKLFMIFTVLTALVAALFSTLYVFREIHLQKDSIAETLRLQTEQLAENVRLPLYAENREALQRLAEQAAGKPETCSVTITTASGMVLTDISRPNCCDPAQRISTSIEVRSATLAGSPESAFSGGSEVAALIGTVRVERGMDELASKLRKDIQAACAATIAFWFVMSCLGYMALRQVIRSFDKLVDGVEIIQSGDYEVRIDVKTDDEPGRMATAINGLADALQKREVENQRLHEELVNAMRLEVREEKRRMMAKLIQANRMTSLGLLASSMAHEINNPNAAIRLAGAQLARSWADALPLLRSVAEEEGDFSLGGIPFSSAGTELLQSCATIERNTERIDQIVKHLRSYSLGERLECRPDLDLNQVVSRSLVIIRSLGNNTASGISAEITPDLPLIAGNCNQLEQVLVNLILNAIQALPGGVGKVVVSSGYLRETNRVVVTVSDDGPGIAAADLEHIMEPFYSTRIDKGGSGLGLYISNFIVSEHNGRIEFASIPGDGTTVTVSFPAISPVKP